MRTISVLLCIPVFAGCSDAPPKHACPFTSEAERKELGALAGMTEGAVGVSERQIGEGAWVLDGSGGDTRGDLFVMVVPGDGKTAFTTTARILAYAAAP